jgi:hypothetical protein
MIDSQTTEERGLYDVIAVDQKTLAKRLIASEKTRPDAEAIVKFAVMRRGVEKEFFDVVPSGSWQE